MSHALAVNRSRAWMWLALHLLALWPHGAWMLQRLRDGSDEPLGLVAIVLVIALVAKHRKQLSQQPHAAWMLGTLGATVASALAVVMHAPALVSALLAALALACHLAAWLPAPAAWLPKQSAVLPQVQASAGTGAVATMPRLALGGLVMLSLPLIASLQFYLGYPLRLVTAQLSAWLLQGLGVPATRDGVAMTVRGQLVIVDAPCSGVQMAWFAYATACTVACWLGLSERRFLQRVVGVGAWVLVANALRNALLVVLEARPQGLSSTAHEALGLMVLALTVLAVGLWMAAGTAMQTSRSHLRPHTPTSKAMGAGEQAA